MNVDELINGLLFHLEEFGHVAELVHSAANRYASHVVRVDGVDVSFQAWRDRQHRWRVKYQGVWVTCGLGCVREASRRLAERIVSHLPQQRELQGKLEQQQAREARIDQLRQMAASRSVGFYQHPNQIIKLFTTKSVLPLLAAVDADVVEERTFDEWAALCDRHAQEVEQFEKWWGKRDE